MALLSIQDRTRVWRGLMRRWSKDRIVCNFLKTSLYNPASDTGCIADVDAWRDPRAGLTSPDLVGINGAINITYRAQFSPEQKTDIFIAVTAMARGLDYLKSIVGEVD